MQLHSLEQSCVDLLRQARRSFESHAFEKAAQLLTKAVDVCPQRAEALVSLGQTQFLLGEEAAAEQTLREAIIANTKDTSPRYALGRIYYQQGRYPEAVTLFESVLALEPENYRAHDNLALSYDMLQRDSEALRHFFKALDLVKDAHRDYDWAYANLAGFFLKRDQFEKAFQLAAEAAARNPAAARNFFLTGQALIKLGRDADSLKWLARAVELEPGHGEAHYLLAQALRRLGRTDEARRHLEDFRRIKARAPSESGPPGHP